MNEQLMLTDSAQLGSILKLFALKSVSDPLETVNNRIKQPQRSKEEVWVLSNSLE